MTPATTGPVFKPIRTQCSIPASADRSSAASISSAIRHGLRMIRLRPGTPAATM